MLKMSMISVRHIYITAIGALLLSFFPGFSAGRAQAELTEPHIRLVYAAPLQPYGTEMNPAFQEEVLQEIRLYRILDSLINQLTLEIEVDGNESSQGGIIFEIPIEVTTPPESEQPQLQLEFEIKPDSLR
jgi:hypothetical protein